MRSNKSAVFGITLVLGGCIGGCASKPDSPSIPVLTLPNGAVLASKTGVNVLTLTVNGSNCAANSYPNKPCVSVTICTPGTGANCQTITDILLDTGSYGLRVFKSVLNPALASSLTQVTSGGKNVAECAQFGDGSADWGPVQLANVILGGEPAVQVPIHVIDSTFGTVPGSCPHPNPDPATAGQNGILGVGLFAQDCGATCVTQANNNVYFGCSGATCTGATVSAANQVQDPVALLPKDNNGVIVEFPSVSTDGAPSAVGYLVLGIGTRSNNPPAGVQKFSADPASGNFSASFNGKSYPSFLDTGSNALLMQAPADGSLPDCGASDPSAAGFFCPASVQTLSATTSGTSGSAVAEVPFQIGNLISLATNSNNVFPDIGADGSLGGTEYFDWGLPFHLGRNVYVGFEATTSSLGTGPYWAY